MEVLEKIPSGISPAVSPFVYPSQCKLTTKGNEDSALGGNPKTSRLGIRLLSSNMDIVKPGFSNLKVAPKASHDVKVLRNVRQENVPDPCSVRRVLHLSSHHLRNSSSLPKMAFSSATNFEYATETVLLSSIELART